MDLEKLEKCAFLDDTEIGEYVISLVSVRRFTTDHGMTSKFSSELDRELKYWLKRFESETEIMTHEIPQPNRIVTELIWTGIDD